MERGAWHLFPLKNQKDGNNRDSPIRAERIASSRPQPQMNEPELGDSVPMASSLLTAMPAASSEVWSHPSCGRGGTGGSGSRRRPLPVPLSRHLLRTSRLGCRCHAGPRYWTKANNGDRYWRFGGKSHIRLPGRRGMSLSPAFRATHGWESRRWGKMYRASVTSSSGTLGIPSHSRIRKSATTATPRFALRGPPPRDRNHK